MSKTAITNYQLRPAVQGDFDFFKKVHHATLRPYVEPLFGWDEAWQAEYLKSRYNPDEMKIIQVDGQDAGVLVFGQEPDRVFVKQLLIDPIFQGRGLGTVVLHDMIEQARASKLPLSLSVLRSNLPAKRFYQRHGFVEAYHDEQRVWMHWEPSGQTGDPLVIMASSRSHGHTRHTLDQAFRRIPYQLIDLHGKSISYFDYDHHNRLDDFLWVAEQMVAAKRIVLVTPLYWSAISGVMKVFIDRFTDLTDIRQDLGDGLAGKKLWLMVAGKPEVAPVGIEIPFVEICNHFKMDYQGMQYAYIGQDRKLETASEVAAAEFAKQFS